MSTSTGTPRGAGGPFGMAPSLRVPIAATDVGAIVRYGYTIVDFGRHSIEDRGGDVHRPIGAAAIKVQATRIPRRDAAPLWRHSEADEYFAKLHTRPQLWVHVQYGSYRAAWKGLGLQGDWGTLRRLTYLDHIQNREAIRLRDSDYPLIRLMPVPHGVNSNAGNPNGGGERMEVEYLRKLKSTMSEAEWRAWCQPSEDGLLFADPFDLTKMLGLSPGTRPFPGVNGFQQNFYLPRPRGTAP